jgi:RND family efflux transporter MFP subunit
VTPPPTPLVQVSLPIAKETSDYEDFTGRTDAVSSVQIRARVSGYLVKVHFTDGKIVHQGDLLYEIDPRPFQADLDQAKGQLEQLQSQKKLLDIQVERYRKLAQTQAGSQQELDQYLAQQAGNIGALKAAQAQVDRAALNLDFTKITAPITGQIGRTLLTVGNLVNADQTELTTLVSMDPMYAYFDVEEPTVLRIRKMIREGVIPTRNTREIAVHMGLADDTARKFPLQGTLNFVNNTVDAQTGTIQVRGLFANSVTSDGKPPMLSPGMFVRVRLPMGLPHQVLLVNERAIGTDQGQKFVYVIGPKNQVAYRPVKLGLVFDGLRAVESGLKPGERVVVNGLQRIRPGIAVQAETVDMATLSAPQPPGGGKQNAAGPQVKDPSSLAAKTAG